jgi:hypothetical protein
MQAKSAITAYLNDVTPLPDYTLFPSIFDSTASLGEGFKIAKILHRCSLFWLRNCISQLNLQRKYPT